MTVTILRQPQACRPTGGNFQHAPALAWFVRTIVVENQYCSLADSDVAMECLELLDGDTWDLLSDTNVFDTNRIKALRHLVTAPDSTVGFYPVVRLRPANANPLKLPLPHSTEELALLSENFLQGLTRNRFKLSRSARQRLGSGEHGARGTKGANNVELLELELSDGSLLLGWGWVWYAS